MFQISIYHQIVQSSIAQILDFMLVHTLTSPQKYGILRIPRTKFEKVSTLATSQRFLKKIYWMKNSDSWHGYGLEKPTIWNRRHPVVEDIVMIFIGLISFSYEIIVLWHAFYFPFLANGRSDRSYHHVKLKHDMQHKPLGSWPFDKRKGVSTYFSIERLILNTLIFSRKPDFLIEESANYNSKRCVNARTCYKGFYFCSNSTPPFILNTSQATPGYYHDAMRNCQE